MKRGDSWLNNKKNYQKIRSMVRAVKILGVTGDLLDAGLISRIGDDLSGDNLRVSVSYISNISEWIGEKIRLVINNIAALPLGRNSLLIDDIHGENRLFSLSSKEFLNRLELAVGENEESITLYLEKAVPLMRSMIRDQTAVSIRRQIDDSKITANKILQAV